MSTGVIIGMASFAVGGAVTEMILSGMGKANEGQIVKLVTISGLVATGIIYFSKAMVALGKLGG
jgi:hypothetical protein